MTPTLIQTVKTYFTSDFTLQAANALNEKKSSISKALTAIIPAGLAGILNKATTGKEGAHDIFDRSKNSAINLPEFHDLSKLNNEAQTTNNTSDIFGANQSLIDGTIARYAGIKDSSAATLMALALPAIMGLIGKHAGRKKLSASGLSGFLSSQKDDIIYAMPSGIASLASILGFSPFDTMDSPIISTINTGVIEKKEAVTNGNGGSMKWIAPLVIILIAITALWHYGKSCNKPVENTMPVTDSSITMNTLH